MVNKNGYKIAIITPFLSGNGGTESVLESLLYNGLYDNNEKQVNLIILGSGINKDWLSRIDSSVSVNILSKNKCINWVLLIFQILFGDYDRIICLSTKIIKFTYLLRKVTNLKYFIFSWIHFSLIDESTVDYNVLNLADYNLAISTGIYKQMEKLGISKNKIKLIFNPVFPKNRIIASSHGSKIKVAYIGRVMLNGQKNLQELFNSLRLLEDDTVVVHLYGTGDIKECKRFIEKNNIKQEFIWHGWINNPWDDIDTMDFIVLTSLFEGFPMTLLESISYGVPVVSSNCPTGPADIINQENGFLYESGDIWSLSKYIKRFDKEIFNRNDVKKTSKMFYVNEYNSNFWKYVTKLDK